MIETALKFVGLLCSGLAAGITVCVFLAGRAFAGSGQFYTELMQMLNRALTVPAPLLGAVALLAIAVDAALLFKRGGGVAAWLGVAAVVLSVAAAALTKLGHFPINDQILTWDPANPPADWIAVQAKWSALHVARTISAVGSFALFLLGTLVRR